MDGFEIRQPSAHWRLGDPLGRLEREAPRQVSLARFPTVAQIFQPERSLGHFCAEFFPGFDRMFDHVELFRIELIPGVVNRRVAGAVGLRPRLLDGIRFVPVEADPEGRLGVFVPAQ